MTVRISTHTGNIAVVGMSGRFPGAGSVDEYWRNLRAGVVSIADVSDEDLLAEGVPTELFRRPEYVRAAAVLDGIDQFDAGFFNLSNREAALLDPQQRLFLETAWHALEDAGRGPGTDSDVGVFAGAGMSAYLMSNLLGGNRVVTSPSMFELQIHNDKDYLASRTAFLLGLTGPAVTVQTACSSSLVAVHQAARALLAGDCGTAIAGGVCVRVPHRVGYLFEEGLIYSPDGVCRPFDADARGTVFGNGVGVVVLRRLEDALADGDTVHAVIRGTAVNNDGSDKVGYTAPSVAGQERLITLALDAAGVDAGTITALEAHGTGTQVGDPIEITALTRAMSRHSDATGYCALGSVKANIGHLESAAGIASLIKAVLQLKHRELTPDPHFRNPNPKIDFARTPFFVNTEAAHWANGTHPRRIGVSSFGIGGTNAHAILEEAPTAPAEPAGPARPQVVVLSAKSPKALDQAGERLADFLADSPDGFGGVAATLRRGRGPLRFRRALVAADSATAVDLLRGGDPTRVAGSAAPLAPPRVVFLFPGQGTQYPGMGRGLYEHEEVFRAEVDRCADLLAPLLGLDLRDALYAADAEDPEAAARLARTGLAQPALFVTEYALARQLASWGVEPDAMVGHSLGEFVAATLAGVLELPDVLRLVGTRGRLMQELPPGGMLSVAAAEDRVSGLLSGGLSVAAVNAPGLCVVSGPDDELAALRVLLSGMDVGTRPLHTSHAFHSAVVDPIVPEFTAEVARAALRRPDRRIRSTVTTGWLESEATDAEYWGAHMRRPVRFGAAVRDAVAELGPSVLLEVGPGNTLGTLARQAVASRVPVLTGMRRPDQEGSDVDVLLSALSGLWLAGVEVDWARSQPVAGRVPLPGYPFQHRRHWIEPRGTSAAALSVEVAEQPADEAETRPDHLMSSYTAPRDELETAIAGLWSEFFGIARIGVHDNFFELGGHSLLATQILNRLRTRIGRTATPSQLLARPTVAGLAGLLATATPDEIAPDLPELVAEPARRHEPFPLNEMQQAQWIGRLGSFDMGGVAPHVYLEFDSTTLDPRRLERAWRQVVRKHEMLRIVVLPDGRQRVLATVPDYRLAELDLRGLAPEEARARLAEVSDRMSTEVRSADTWPLWEVRVSRLDDDTIRTHISFDLLCADVASFFYQVLPAWRDFYTDPARSAEPDEVSFRDYVLAEESLRETDLYERSLRYWQQRVRDLPPAPELPTVVAPGELARPTFVRKHGVLSTEVWAAIRERAGEHGVTPSSVLLAAYAAAIGRWSRSQHFTLNFTAVNRLPFHGAVDDMVGEFASFELLEVDLRAVRTFGELVTQVQARSWADFEHRYVSGVRILRELNRLRRDTTGGVMPIVFTSALPTETDAAALASPVAWLGERAGFISQTPQVSIDHFVLELEGRLELAWHAVDGLFPDGLMGDVFDAYQELLASLTEPAGWGGAPLAALPPAQSTARARANDTGGPLPAGLLTDRVLAAGADPASATRPAVVTADRVLTHAELSGRAVEVARALTDRGFGAGAVVGVGLAKSWRQVVAVVGTSAAGCVYVPIDPELPEQRRRWLVEHAGVECLVLGADDDHVWPDDVARVVVRESDDWTPAPGWTCPASPDQVAYVIYTSGSTGTPKGVAVTHTAALNTLADVEERFGITARDKVLGLSSLSFDLSVFDVFGILGAGAALVLPDASARRDPAHWADLVRAHGVTVWNSVPALLEMLVTYLEGEGGAVPLRLAMLSGDWIPVRLPDRARALVPELSVVSLGGATEAAVWSIAYPVGEVPPEWTSIPYGFPLRNQTFHVLNDRMEPAPVWTTGRLFIGGAGLAACYWNDEERTAASFVRHPVTGDRLYLTGDLGRYLPDGSIEFLGREDFQVKIGGFRVELGEVEHAIGAHPAVQAVVATAVGERTQQRLVAYVVPAEGTDPAALPDAVRAHLTDVVPHYLVPADFVLLDAFPLSGNGKVDRAALPAPDRAGQADDEEPAGETAVALLALAREILGVETAGGLDNFFALGGDSIMGIRFVSRAAAEGLRISPQDLFESDHFQDLARRLDQAADQRADAAAIPLTAHQALLAAGRRVTRQVLGAGGTDPAVAERAVRELLRRHDALRLRLGVLPDGSPGQFDGGVPDEGLFTELDLAGLPATAVAEIVEEIAAETDPATGPAAKVALLHTDDGDHLVFLVASVAADDGSWPVLRGDFEHARRALAETGSVTWATQPGSFLAWADDHAGSDDRAGEEVSEVEEVSELTGELRTSLTAEETSALRDAAFGGYRLGLGEAVAAALALALHRVGGPALVAERSARPSTLDGTVGRFTGLVAVDVTGGDPAEVVPTVKRRIRQGTPPGDGPRIVLRELADHDGAEADGPHSTTASAETVAEVAGVVAAGALHLTWRHRGAPEVAGVAGAFADAARTVAEHCARTGTTHYEPSDFPLADIGPDELTALLSTFEERQA
ncbi:amino acid adenylation domain-containing protein [Actinosynnema sp. NPDC023587]|uniref:non-ribosomal peptide synthetase/type I polyketide synthase n=1 Tax=Actinosynnema sp. NPDC023587 TaxID=3154695 RepID=UPI0034055A02